MTPFRFVPLYDLPLNFMNEFLLIQFNLASIMFFIRDFFLRVVLPEVFQTTIRDRAWGRYPQFPTERRV